MRHAKRCTAKGPSSSRDCNNASRVCASELGWRTGAHARTRDGSRCAEQLVRSVPSAPLCRVARVSLTGFSCSNCMTVLCCVLCDVRVWLRVWCVRWLLARCLAFCWGTKGGRWSARGQAAAVARRQRRTPCQSVASRQHCGHWTSGEGGGVDTRIDRSRCCCSSAGGAQSPPQLPS